MSEHILVVDDDELVRSGLEIYLAQQGFRVTTAATGAAALRVVTTDRPALALCDLVLEDINGIQLMKKIHEARPGTAVILITGHGSIGNALDALRNGAADYIQKPADPEEVVHRIRTVLHAMQLRQALEAEREKMELRRRESSQQQMRHDRMAAVGLMAEGAAHALSDILRPVLTYTPTIRASLPEGGPARALLDEVEQAGIKAEELLGDLHYIGTGTGAGKVEMDIGALVSEVSESAAAASLRETGRQVKWSITAGTEGAPVLASREFLGRALNNLILFAAESSSGPDAALSISVATQQLDRPSGRYGPGKPGRYVVMAIHDEGPGLNVEDLDRLFEPFYTLRLGLSISGLALPLVYRVVADHGGSLDVTSAPGRGTTFTIYLPVAGVHLDEPVELRADYSGGETILLVDDSEEQRAQAAELLGKQGYQVIQAGGGAAALARFEEAMQEGSTVNIDLAVIDLVLAEPRDGLDVFLRMVEIRPRQKAVLASGFADLARLAEARRSGIGRVIQKPYAQDNLIPAVRELLDT